MNPTCICGHKHGDHMVAGRHACSLCQCHEFILEAPREFQPGETTVKIETLQPGMEVMVPDYRLNQGQFTRQERWGKVREIKLDSFSTKKNMWWLSVSFPGHYQWVYVHKLGQDEVIVRS